MGSVAFPLEGERFCAFLNMCARYKYREIKIGAKRGAEETWGDWCNKLCVWALGRDYESVVVPVASRTLLIEKGLRHMVIQIQFRYSQHSRLQQKGRRIGQVDWLPHVKGALRSLSHVLCYRIYSCISPLILLHVDPVCLKQNLSQAIRGWYTSSRMRLFLPIIVWAG